MRRSAPEMPCGGGAVPNTGVSSESSARLRISSCGTCRASATRRRRGITLGGKASFGTPGRFVGETSTPQSGTLACSLLSLDLLMTLSSLLALGDEHALDHAVPLLVEEPVGLLRVLQREAVRDERLGVEAAGADVGEQVG